MSTDIEKASKKAHPKVPDFALRLRALRAQRNLSLRDAEKRTGGNMSRQTFQRAEHGDAELDTIIAMLKVYKASKAEAEKVLEEFSKHQLAEAKASLKDMEAA